MTCLHSTSSVAYWQIIDWLIDQDSIIAWNVRVLLYRSSFSALSMNHAMNQKDSQWWTAEMKIYAKLIKSSLLWMTLRSWPFAFEPQTHLLRGTARELLNSKPFLFVLPFWLTHKGLAFLPARRYASAGYRDRNVSVCLSVRLSVRHAPVLCQNEES